MPWYPYGERADPRPCFGMVKSLRNTWAVCVLCLLKIRDFVAVPFLLEAHDLERRVCSPHHPPLFSLS